MGKSYKTCSNRRVMLWIVFLALFLLLTPAEGLTKNSPKSLLTRSGAVTIDGKTGDAVLVSERHFAVTEATIILDLNNKEIQLSDLPVPCKADITYRLIMDQDPLTLKIKVNRLLKGATRNWPPWGLESSTTRTRNQYNRGGFLKNQ